MSLPIDQDPWYPLIVPQEDGTVWTIRYNKHSAQRLEHGHWMPIPRDERILQAIRSGNQEVSHP